MKVAHGSKKSAASHSAAMLDCADFARGPRAPEVIFNLYAKGHWLNYDWQQPHDTLFKIARMCCRSPDFTTRLLAIWDIRQHSIQVQCDGPVVEMTKALTRLGWDMSPEGVLWTRTESGFLGWRIRANFSIKSVTDSGRLPWKRWRPGEPPCKGSGGGGPQALHSHPCQRSHRFSAGQGYA